MNQKHEKNQAGEIVVNNRFFKKLDNFWYHYKWPVILISFFLIVGVICFTQCATKEKSDLRVAFAGDFSVNSKGEPIQAEDMQQFVDLLESFAPLNEDGNACSIKHTSFYIRNPENLKDEYTGMDFNSIKATISENMSAFDTHIMLGDSAVYFVSLEAYEIMPNIRTLMRPLANLYGDAIPASAYDAYAIRLGDTAFYQYYDLVNQMLPPDTLILLPAQLQMGGSAPDEVYARYEQLFRAIVEFQAP